eukprot:6288572-Pyramimonas_sp.AAC.1
MRQASWPALRCIRRPVAGIVLLDTLGPDVDEHGLQGTDLGDRMGRRLRNACCISHAHGRLHDVAGEHAQRRSP